MAVCLLHEDSELVSTESGRGVRGTQGLPQALADLPQQLVPGSMAQ